MSKAVITIEDDDGAIRVDFNYGADVDQGSQAHKVATMLKLFLDHRLTSAPEHPEV